jgi:hypothetical protein
MLDPLSALSLAAAIVQFVDYGTKIVLSAAEIHASATGSLTKNVELSSITIDLSDISSKLVLDNRTQRDKYSKDEQALSSLAMQLLQLTPPLASGKGLAGKLHMRTRSHWSKEGGTRDSDPFRSRIV